jgi:pimeloyl-ACP methyl ester carboxylesterase
MPYASNALDGTRVYFEDDGGDGSPVVLHGGILDSVDLVRHSSIALTLPPDEFRLIYVDHRGVGRSDKPHDPASYAMRLRVADAVAVLDELALDRAHFVGTSWGGRLGFGIGEHAPDRVLSLVMGGQQPYAIDPRGPLTRVVEEGLVASRTNGIEAFVSALEAFSEIRFASAQRGRYLQNDPAAIEAAWRAALDEGAVSEDLRSWRIPCLIFVGADDADFHDQARRAATEIPDAEFISIAAQDHLGAHLGHDPVTGPVLRLFRPSR